MRFEERYDASELLRLAYLDGDDAMFEALLEVFSWEPTGSGQTWREIAAAALDRYTHTLMEQRQERMDLLGSLDEDVGIDHSS